MEELSDDQFVDDTSLLIELLEDNTSNLTSKLEIFYRAFANKVLIVKSIMLGWDENPSSLYSNFCFS